METIKVLVVDDNKAHAEGLAELLGLSGFDSSFVLTGLDAIKMAEQLSVDAVLLDMGLPDIKGYEVCRRLRINPVTANVAVIFHTGSQPLPHRNYEADAFLTYPISTAEVFAVIRGCVERRRAKYAHQKPTDGEVGEKISCWTKLMLANLSALEAAGWRTECPGRNCNPRH